MAQLAADYDKVSRFKYPEYLFRKYPAETREPQVLTLGPTFSTRPVAERIRVYKQLLEPEFVAPPVLASLDLTQLAAEAGSVGTRQCYEVALQNILRPDDLVTDSLWLAAWLYSRLEMRVGDGLFLHFFQTKYGVVQRLTYLMPTDIVLLGNQIPMPLLKDAVQILFCRSNSVVQQLFPPNHMLANVNWPGEILQMLLLNALSLLSPFNDSQIQHPGMRISPGSNWTFDNLKNWRDKLRNHLVDPITDHLHLLDYSYSKVCNIDNFHRSPPPLYSIQEPIVIPTASELNHLGFKFESFPWKAWRGQREQNEGQLIRLEGRTLYLPSVKLYDVFVPKMLSFLAYECIAKDTFFLRSFMHVMHCLIDNAQDVEVLKRAGVLKGRMGHESVASFFGDGTHNLHIRLLVSTEEALKNVNLTCKRKWKIQLGTLVHRFFHSGQPWLVPGVMFALVLFLLAVIQTICAIKQTEYAVKSYHHPPHGT